MINLLVGRQQAQQQAQQEGPASGQAKGQRQGQQQDHQQALRQHVKNLGTNAPPRPTLEDYIERQNLQRARNTRLDATEESQRVNNEKHAPMIRDYGMQIAHELFCEAAAELRAREHMIGGRSGTHPLTF